MAVKWIYEKLDENGKIKNAPLNDMDGKITGHIVYGLQAWFDEHPEERMDLGWIKHLRREEKDIAYNHQTQYLRISVRQVDAYTVENVYEVMDKTEEMMLREEENGEVMTTDGIVFYGGMLYE